MRRSFGALLAVCGCLNAVILTADQENSSAEERAPTLEKTLPLEGKAFFEAAHRISYAELSLPDLLKLTEKVVAELRNAVNDDDRYLFDSFFQEACRKAGAPDIDRLAAIYARIPSESFAKE